MRALLLAITLAWSARAETPHASLAAVPARLRTALSTAIPRSVWLTWYGEANGITTMKGRAGTFDDVSEFMRSLNNMVQCPKGLGRVVERQRKGGFRVELLGPRTPPVLEFAEVQFLFPRLELRSTITRGEFVEFELTFAAAP